MLRRAKGFDLDYYDDYELPERRFAPSGRHWPPWISYSSERVSKVSSAPRSMSGSMWCASPMPQDRMKEDCTDGTTSSEEARRRSALASREEPQMRRWADNLVGLFAAGMTPQRGGHSAHARRGRPSAVVDQEPQTTGIASLKGGRPAGQGTARIGRVIGLRASDLAGAAMLFAVAAYGL